MHAVQSALAIKRERERRQSLKGQRPNSRKPSTDSTLPPMAPSDFRPLPESNGTFTYTTVGISFIIFGSLMLVPIFAGGHEFVGLDWHHLLGKIFKKIALKNAIEIWNVNLVKKLCAELYRDGKINRTGNYRYFV